MIWFLMICCGAITFAARFLPLSGLLPKELPPIVQRAMHFVPIAVLTPIIVSGIFISPDGDIHLIDNMRIYAAIIASVAAVISRSILATLASGLISLWVLNFWL